MLDHLTAPIEVALGQLALAIAATTSSITSPVLCVHPPSRRHGHRESVQVQHDAVEALLITVRRMETKIASLRDTIHGHQRACSFALTPVSALPNKMLCSIFELAAQDVWDPLSDRPSGSSFTANAIAAVCSKWRGVAMNFPTLWTAVNIRSITDYSKCYMQHVFKRSLDKPISLRIDGTYSEPRAAFMDDEHLRRLQELSITVTKGAVKTFTDICGQYEKLSALATLNLANLDGRNEYFVLYFGIPSLRTLGLKHANAQVRAKNLTTLRLEYPPLYYENDFYATLAGCRRITTLTLEGIDAILGHVPSSDPIVLQDLESVFIRFTSPEPLMEILSWFTAPHLVTFSLTDVDPDELADEDEEINSEDGELLEDEDVMTLTHEFSHQLGLLVSGFRQFLVVECEC